jgi:hypothetical protein
MPASERARRTILQKSKYQSVVPVTQHIDAKVIIANHLRSGKGNKDDLEEKTERLSRKICDSEFEEKQLRHNIDYLRRFAAVAEKMSFPKAEILPAQKFAPLTIRGTRVNFSPQLLTTRVTRTNTVRIGAVAFRYAKGVAVDDDVAAYQAAFGFGYLKQQPFKEQADAEEKLCLVVDNFTGEVHEAPGNSTERFNNMSAACATIADCWEAIPPPPKAVIA